VEDIQNAIAVDLVVDEETMEGRVTVEDSTNHLTEVEAAIVVVVNQCMMLFVLIVDETAKYHLDQMEKNQYIAVTVLTKTVETKDEKNADLMTELQDESLVLHQNENFQLQNQIHVLMISKHHFVLCNQN
jgi:hypothetical protein